MMRRRLNLKEKYSIGGHPENDPIMLPSQNHLQGFFDEEGLSGPGTFGLTPELAVRAGSAIGSLGAGTVGIACDGSRTSRVLSQAFAAGIQGAGVSVMDFDHVFEAMFHFGMRLNALSMGIYLTGEPPRARILGECGLPASRQIEQEIERRLIQREFYQAHPRKFGIAMDLSGISSLYVTELIRMAPEGLEGMSANVHSKNPAAEYILSDTLYRMGCEEGGSLHLEVSPDGTQLSISQDGLFFCPKRTIAAYGWTLFERSEDLAVDYDFPRVLDHLAESRGCHILRYQNASSGGQDEAGRELAAHQWTKDGSMLAVVLLSYLHRHKMTLAELDRQIPALAVKEAQISLTMPPARILSQLKGQEAGEGVLLQDNSRGTVLVRPQKNRNALRLFVEAANFEIAQELCTDVIQKVQDLMGRL